MKRKVLFGFDYTEKESVKFLLYLFVGGTAALVEWALFYIFFNYTFATWGLSLSLLTTSSTALAFSLSTLYHYFLGNVLVFESGSRYGKGKELTLVFAVSIMGLLLNLLFMYLFVSLLSWHPMLAKIFTSCLVVFWNYLARKKWIFGS